MWNIFQCTLLFIISESAVYSRCKCGGCGYNLGNLITYTIIYQSSLQEKVSSQVLRMCIDGFYLFSAMLYDMSDAIAWSYRVQQAANNCSCCYYYCCTGFNHWGITIFIVDACF